MPEKVKLCKDCKHGDMYGCICSLPEANGNVLDGEDFCHQARYNKNCGLDGKFWEPKPTLVERIKKLFGGGK